MTRNIIQSYRISSRLARVPSCVSTTRTYPGPQTRVAGVTAAVTRNTFHFSARQAPLFLQYFSSSSSSSSSSSAPRNLSSMSSASKTPIADRMRSKLQACVDLHPLHRLELLDETPDHVGHAGKPIDKTETHFNLLVISDRFENMKMVERHRLIYRILHEELKTHVHALQMKTQTIEENENEPPETL